MTPRGTAARLSGGAGRWVTDASRLDLQGTSAHGPARGDLPTPHARHRDPFPVMSRKNHLSIFSRVGEPPSAVLDRNSRGRLSHIPEGASGDLLRLSVRGSFYLGVTTRFERMFRSN